MLIGKFVEHLKKNECELVPMPEWNNASTLRIIHKKNGRHAFLNTFYEDVWETNMEGICSKLGIPLPPDYSL